MLKNKPMGAIIQEWRTVPNFSLFIVVTTNTNVKPHKFLTSMNTKLKKYGIIQPEYTDRWINKK